MFNIFAIFLMALAIAGEGCAESSDSIRVQICGELVVPTEIDAVRISTLDEDRAEVTAVLDELTPAVRGDDLGVADAGLALDAGVVDGAEDPVGAALDVEAALPAGRGLGWVVVQGLRDGVEVIRAEARGRKGARVTIAFSRACVGVRCPLGRTCAAGACELALEGGAPCDGGDR